MRRQMIPWLLIFIGAQAIAAQTGRAAKVKRAMASSPHLEACYEFSVPGKTGILYLILQTQKAVPDRPFPVYLTAVNAAERSWFSGFQCGKPAKNGPAACRGADDSGAFTLKVNTKEALLIIDHLSFGNPQEPGPSIKELKEPLRIKGKAFNCDE